VRTFATMIHDEWMPPGSEGEGEDLPEHGSMFDRWDEEPLVGGLPPSGEVAEALKVVEIASDSGEEAQPSGSAHAFASAHGKPCDGHAEPPARGRGGQGGRTGRGRPRGAHRGARFGGSRAAACPRRFTPLKNKAPKRKRTLKRHLSDDPKPDEPEATTMVCVWGGSLKHPAVVGTTGTWLSLNEHKYWIRRACCGNGQTYWKENFQSAISALRREATALIRKALNPSADLREKLQLSDDEFEAPQPARRQAKQTNGQVEVTLMGFPVKMKTNTRPLFIAVTQESVNAVIAFCRKHIKEGPVQLKKDTAAGSQQAACPQEAACPRKSFAMPVDACPSIIGKVTWQASRTAWSVHGKSEHGEKFSKRCKVTVPTEKKGFLTSGGGLSPGEESVTAKDAFHVARRKAYIEAIKMWNAEDYSTRERIVEPDH